MCTNIVHCFEILFPFILGIHPQREGSIIAMSSTAVEKDPSDEKTDTYNLASGESGVLLLSMAGRQNDSFQPALLLAEVP